jgi:hypothetical protein
MHRTAEVPQRAAIPGSADSLRRYDAIPLFPGKINRQQPKHNFM